MENLIKSKNIAVIGGCGRLNIYKIAKELGLNPTMFEKNQEIGGNWGLKCGKIWPDLVTNISKYFSQFTDFIWHETDEPFPNKTSINTWLELFYQTFNLDQNTKLNTLVFNCKRMSDGTIRVTYKTGDDKPIEQFFDYIIVRTGIYSKNDYLHLSKYFENKCDIEMINSNYKYPEHFKGKNVIVVGNGNSGAEIAADICLSAKTTINLFRKPYWIDTKYTNNIYNKKLPRDFSKFSLYSKEAIYLQKELPDNELTF